MLLRQFQTECKYILDYLIDIHTSTEHALYLAEEILKEDSWIRNKEYRYRTTVENNLFYLDAIRILLNNAIEYMQSLDFNIFDNIEDNFEDFYIQVNEELEENYEFEEINNSEQGDNVISLFKSREYEEKDITVFKDITIEDIFNIKYDD